MAKIFIQTFGCSLNHSDSEAMAGFLAWAGHTIADSIEDADLVVINSCSVKHLAESKLFKSIRQNSRKKIVVAGCVPMAEKSYLKTKLKNYSVIGTDNLHDIIEAANQTLKGNVYHNLQSKKEQRLNIPKIRKNPVVEIIPICKGCLGNCAYCKTKQARGNLESYPIKDIKKQMESAIAEGCKEIWITAQDVGCYGHDIGTNIIELLNELLKTRGFFRLRIGMMNPNYALEYLDGLKEILKHPKVFRFLHLPVQSGSDRLLRLMGRKYSVNDFIKVVQEMRLEIPNITISTDIIVALPTETEKEFMESYNLIKNTEPEVLNYTRYWTRPNTRAAGMEQVKGNISKNRGKKIAGLFTKIITNKNKQWIGWEGEALVDEKGPNQSMIAKNDYYKQIILSNKYMLGQRIKIKITKSMKYDLRP